MCTVFKHISKLSRYYNSEMQINFPEHSPSSVVLKTLVLIVYGMVKAWGHTGRHTLGYNKNDWIKQKMHGHQITIERHDFLSRQSLEFFLNFAVSHTGTKILWLVRHCWAVTLKSLTNTVVMSSSPADAGFLVDR